MPTTEALADGTLGKVHVTGKVEEGRAKAMTQLLTSSTCRNRYIYGWRLCTVTYFPCPLKQGNESFNLYSDSVSQLSSLHIYRDKYTGILHTSMCKKNWLFPTTGYITTQENPQTIQIALPYISCLKLLHAEP